MSRTHKVNLSCLSEVFADGGTTIEYMDTKDQAAHISTKALQPQKWGAALGLLGMYAELPLELSSLKFHQRIASDLSSTARMAEVHTDAWAWRGGVKISPHMYIIIRPVYRRVVVAFPFGVTYQSHVVVTRVHGVKVAPYRLCYTLAQEKGTCPAGECYLLSVWGHFGKRTMKINQVLKLKPY